MEEREPLALVLRMSRIAGLAPYDSLQRLRVSRTALVYSYLLHIVSESYTELNRRSLHQTQAQSGVIMLSLHVFGGVIPDVVDYRELLWIINVAFLEIALWVALVRGPKKLRNILILLSCVKKICKAIKYNYTTNAKQRVILRTFMFMALTIVVSVVLDIQIKLLHNNEDNKTALLQYRDMLFDIKCFSLVLLTLQFVLMAMKMNPGMQGVNQGLEHLYKELCPDGDLEKNEGNFLPDPGNIISAIHFINVKPKMLATFDHRSACSRLRSLACAYVSTCDIVNKLSDAAGSLLFQLLVFNILNLLLWIYFVIELSDSMNNLDLMSVSLFSKSSIICFLHIGMIILLVIPGHNLSEEVENTRFLVSHISCEATSCINAFRAELNVFFVHLKVNQPCYTVLGTWILGRPLFLTVAAFVITYLAVLLEL